MTVGQQCLCDILVKGKRTGKAVPVQITAIKRNHMTQEPRCVHVATLTSPKRSLWVQPEFLKA